MTRPVIAPALVAEADQHIAAPNRMWLCRTCQEPCAADSPFCADACQSKGIA